MILIAHLFVAFELYIVLLEGRDYILLTMAPHKIGIRCGTEWVLGISLLKKK